MQMKTASIQERNCVRPTPDAVANMLPASVFTGIRVDLDRIADGAPRLVSLAVHQIGTLSPVPSRARGGLLSMA